MSAVGPGSTGPSLVGRIVGVLTHPARTWEAIEREPATVGDLYKGYVAPLAAIPAVCGLVGMLAVGLRIMGATYRTPLATALTETVVNYALTLAGVYVLAKLVDALAPSFGGSRSEVQAFKLVAYSGTAAWLAGVFALYPSLGWLVGVVGGLYSLYTLYLGLPRLMKAPQERALSYFAVVLVLAAAMAILIGLVTSKIRDTGGPVSVAEGPGRAG